MRIFFFCFVLKEVILLLHYINEAFTNSQNLSIANNGPAINMAYLWPEASLPWWTLRHVADLSLLGLGARVAALAVFAVGQTDHQSPLPSGITGHRTLQKQRPSLTEHQQYIYWNMYQNKHFKILSLMFLLITIILIKLPRWPSILQRFYWKPIASVD